ncbi:hypothetical protein B0H14DRAFT_3891775 [Mycena olivaceomarginata]|nr:hypothetical protein B0H14DRAFT_3891775 [Mycena olivaceomarginata]
MGSYRRRSVSTATNGKTSGKTPQRTHTGAGGNNDVGALQSAIPGTKPAVKPGVKQGRKAAPGDVANQERAAAADAAVSTDTVAGLRAMTLLLSRPWTAQPPERKVGCLQREVRPNVQNTAYSRSATAYSSPPTVYSRISTAYSRPSSAHSRPSRHWSTPHTRIDDHEHAPKLLKMIPKPRGKESIQIGMRLARSIEGNTLYGTARATVQECVSHADMDIAVPMEPQYPVPWDKQPLEKRALVINAAKGKVTNLQYMENDWTTQASSDRKYLAANIPIRQPPQFYLNTLTFQPIVYKDDYQQPPELSQEDAKLVKEYPLADDDTSSSLPLYLKLPPCPTPTPNFDSQHPRLRPRPPHRLRRPPVPPHPSVVLSSSPSAESPSTSVTDIILTLDADDDGGSLPSEEVSAYLAEGVTGGDGIGRDVVTGPVCFVPRVVSFRLSRPIGWARSSSGLVASHVLRLASCLLPSPHPSLYHFLSPRLVPPSLPPRLSLPLSPSSPLPFSSRVLPPPSLPSPLYRLVPLSLFHPLPSPPLSPPSLLALPHPVPASLSVFVPVPVLFLYLLARLFLPPSHILSLAPQRGARDQGPGGGERDDGDVGAVFSSAFRSARWVNCWGKEEWGGGRRGVGRGEKRWSWGWEDGKDTADAALAIDCSHAAAATTRVAPSLPRTLSLPLARASTLHAARLRAAAPHPHPHPHLHCPSAFPSLAPKDARASTLQSTRGVAHGLALWPLTSLPPSLSLSLSLLTRQRVHVHSYRYHCSSAAPADPWGSLRDDARRGASSNAILVYVNGARHGLEYHSSFCTTLLAKYRKEGYTSLEKEELVHKAVTAVKDGGTSKNAAEAARAFDIEEQYKTVWRRLTGKTKSRRAAHMTSQLLNESQKKILGSWIKFLGVAGIPLSKRTIAPKLDSKRARAFNSATIQKHFALLQDTLDNGGNPIPASNIYNFDQIGIQIGGGRKSSGKKFFYDHNDRSRYQISSEDLELVTILETLCFDGIHLITIKRGRGAAVEISVFDEKTRRTSAFGCLPP